MKALFVLLFLFVAASTSTAVAQTVSGEKKVLYYPSGEKKAEGKMIGTTRVGQWTLYYESGNVKSSGSYVGGEKDGEWKTFHDTKETKVKVVGNYSKGSKVGVWKEYNELGQQLSKKEY